MKGNLDALRARYGELGQQLSDPAALQDQRRYQELARSHRYVQKQLEAGERWYVLATQVENNRELLAGEKDAEMIVMIKEELDALVPQLAVAAERFEAALLPRDPNDERNAVLEVRAGTGGDEAALFAEEIARMYIRFAERNGW